MTSFSTRRTVRKNPHSITTLSTRVVLRQIYTSHDSDVSKQVNCGKMNNHQAKL